MNSIKQTELNPSNTQTLTKACLASCRKLIAQIERTKDNILAEVRQTLGAPEHLLRLALNEAEALAWQTGYPHLVFPTLAMEKAQSLAVWHQRQRAFGRNDAMPVLAP